MKPMPRIGIYVKLGNVIEKSPAGRINPRIKLANRSGHGHRVPGFVRGTGQALSFREATELWTITRLAASYS
jgi:hypothetical protein